MAVVDDLGQLPIFSGVAPAHLETLAKFADEIDVAAGTELTHEGRVEGAVYVVLSGMFAIEREGRVVDTIGPGNFFGEIATIDGGPRTATGRAIVDSRVIAVSPRQFNDVLDAEPDLQTAVMAEMERRLARIDAEA
jgi:CRP/FNR family transcriptional regulator, cyclic AMP receptor protein